MSNYPEHLSKLILFLKKLPNIGEKTAERLAFHLIGWTPSQLEEFGHLLKNLPEKIAACQECHCLMEVQTQSCRFCNFSIRDPSVLCVLAQPKDVFTLEKTRCFKGGYHIIGELLSPLKNNKLFYNSIVQLKQRTRELKSRELIIALDATLEGDTTALYIKKEFCNIDIKISRLALGVPLGLSFDYLDSGTLEKALLGRNDY